jgi:hypothetical protein
MDQEAEGFVETTGSIARKAEVLPETVRLYADSGLLECRRLANRVRMFKPSAVARVRELYDERMAHKGGRRGAHTAAA